MRAVSKRFQNCTRIDHECAQPSARGARFFRLSMVVLLNFRLTCSLFAPKPAHSSSKLPLFPLNDTTIYRMVMEETRWGAVSPGSEWSIPVFVNDIGAHFDLLRSRVLRRA